MSAHGALDSHSQLFLAYTYMHMCNKREKKMTLLYVCVCGETDKYTCVCIYTCVSGVNIEGRKREGEVRAETEAEKNRK